MALAATLCKPCDGSLESLLPFLDLAGEWEVPGSLTRSLTLDWVLTMSYSCNYYYFDLWSDMGFYCSLEAVCKGIGRSGYYGCSDLLVLVNFLTKALNKDFTKNQ